MDSLVIEGGARLRGTMRVNGSKNAALPLMAGALAGGAGPRCCGMCRTCRTSGTRSICCGNWGARWSGRRTGMLRRSK